MSSIRSYKGIKPQLGERVYVDSTSVLVGDIVIGDDSSVYHWLLRVEMSIISTSANEQISKMAVYYT